MRKLLKKVAKLNKVSVGEVRFEIDKAIDCAMSSSRENEEVSLKWNVLFPDGEMPSMEDFIKRLAEEAWERQAAS